MGTGRCPDPVSTGGDEGPVPSRVPSIGEGFRQEMSRRGSLRRTETWEDVGVLISTITVDGNQLTNDTRSVTRLRKVQIDIKRVVGIPSSVKIQVKCLFLLTCKDLDGHLVSRSEVGDRVRNRREPETKTQGDVQRPEGVLHPRVSLPVSLLSLYVTRR